MPDPTPLGPFLDWLEAHHGYPITVGDRDRVDRFVRVSGVSDLAMLQASLASLLTRDPDAYSAFPAHFGEYFPRTGRDCLNPASGWDAPRWLAELRNYQPEPDPEVRAEPGVERPGPRIETPAKKEERTSSASAPPPPLFSVRTIPWPEVIPRPWANSDASETNRPQVALNLSAYSNRRAQTFFISEVLPPPRSLDDGLLDELAEAMGYFRSESKSELLDLERTIQATIDAGFPVLQFRPGRHLGRVLLLEDLHTAALRWNPIAAELAAGLEVRGVPVTYGRFRGSPEFFQTTDYSYDGHLDDWDESREAVLLLVVTDGAGLFPPSQRRVVEDLATWPRVAWIDPREERFWDDGSALAPAQGIPIFEGTPGGLRALAEQLLSELGGAGKPGRPIAQHDDEAVLGPALAWAAACARLPIATPGIANELRRRHFPEVPWPMYGRLLALRGGYWTGTGVTFSAELERRLYQYFQRLEPTKQAELHASLAEIFRSYLDANRESIPASSPAARACEVWGLMYLLRAGVEARERNQILQRLVELGGPEAPFHSLWDQDVKALVHWEVTEGKGEGELPELHALGLIETSATPALAVDMVAIPAGEFQMGDWSGEGDSDERPVHRVYVSEFAIGRDAVTWELWQKVRTWAGANGYDLEGVGQGAGPQHPVTHISWHDSMKWCNARSEMEQRRPAYFSDSQRTQIIRRATPQVLSEWVDWQSDGYRLPTEAEWEKAARGGLEGYHFPWPSAKKGFEKQISKGQANYGGGGVTPVGEYPANGFGLRDMAGNVHQWLWDSLSTNWYAEPEASFPDTRGPSAGGSANRVFRAGSWASIARDLRCAYRFGLEPSSRNGRLGFRLASGPASVTAASVGRAARRDDESPGRSKRLEAQGCLEVFVPALPEIVITARRSGATESSPIPLSPAGPQVVSPGQWTVEVSAPEHAATVAEIDLEADVAYQVSCALEPKDFVRIPTGEFEMGDFSSVGFSAERPGHRVMVSEFWMGRYPVRWDLWQRVGDWAGRHGYDLGAVGRGFGKDHPVQSVSWWEAVKWCNAFSEMVGRQPAYFLDRAHSTVYRTGTPDLSAELVDWRGPGFRLPTEAEWEKAARGGLQGQHYPWPSAGENYEKLISANDANHSESKIGQTTPVDTYPANDFGLHDMAGNVWQWVWDWKDDRWYAKAEASQADTRGPVAKSALRVIRAGSWANTAGYLRCAFRDGYGPSSRYGDLGFRLASGQGRLAGREGAPVYEVRSDDEPSDVGAAPRSPDSFLKKILKWIGGSS